MDKLTKLKIKVKFWQTISYIFLFATLISLICGIIALIISNDTLGTISIIICLPSLFITPFTIGQFVNLNNRVEAYQYYINNSKNKSKLFYQLVEQYLNNSLKTVFQELGLLKLKISFVVLKNNNMDFSITGIKDKFFITVILNKTYFSLYVDIDEEEEEEVKVNFPKTNNLTELLKLINSEIDKEIKRKSEKKIHND